MEAVGGHVFCLFPDDDNDAGPNNIRSLDLIRFDAVFETTLVARLRMPFSVNHNSLRMVYHGKTIEVGYFIIHNSSPATEGQSEQHTTWIVSSKIDSPQPYQILKFKYASFFTKSIAWEDCLVCFCRPNNEPRLTREEVDRPPIMVHQQISTFTANTPEDTWNIDGETPHFPSLVDVPVVSKKSGELFIFTPTKVFCKDSLESKENVIDVTDWGCCRVLTVASVANGEFWVLVERGCAACSASTPFESGHSSDCSSDFRPDLADLIRIVPSTTEPAKCIRYRTKVSPHILGCSRLCIASHDTEPLIYLNWSSIQEDYYLRYSALVVHHTEDDASSGNRFANHGFNRYFDCDRMLPIEQYSDVAIKCFKTGTTEVTCLRAHRIVLGLQLWFQAKFRVDERTNYEIDLSPHHESTVKEFLCYMYHPAHSFLSSVFPNARDKSGEDQWQNHERVVNLYLLSHFLEVTRLKFHCQAYFAQTMSDVNFLKRLKFLLELNNPAASDLLVMVDSFIMKYGMKEISERLRPGFQHADHATGLVERFFKQKRLQFEYDYFAGRREYGNE